MRGLRAALSTLIGRCVLRRGNPFSRTTEFAIPGEARSGIYVVQLRETGAMPVSMKVEIAK